MNANQRSRARETARASANTAKRVADRVREDMGAADDGDFRNGITSLTEALQALADAVHKLADISEAQEPRS